MGLRSFLFIVLLLLIFQQGNSDLQADATVQNSAPTIVGGSLSASNPLNPEIGNSTIYVNITDNNGWEDIGPCTSTANCNVTCWANGAGEACSKGTRDCSNYALLSNISCSSLACQLRGVINSTVGLTAQSLNGTWTCRVNVRDASASWVTSTTTFAMPQYGKCTISEQTSCAWPSMTPTAVRTAASTDTGRCLNITNTGNSALNVTLQTLSASLSCSGCNGNPTTMAVGNISVNSSSVTSPVALVYNTNVTTAYNIARDGSTNLFFHAGALTAPFAAGTFSLANQLTTYCRLTTTGSGDAYGSASETSTMTLNVPITNVAPSAPTSFSPAMGLIDPNSAQTISVVATDQNGENDIDCTSGCNITCWRSGTEITSTNWDFASNTAPSVSTAYGNNQQAQVSGSFTLDLRALNGTWNCRAWVKDKASNRVTATSSALFTVTRQAGATTDSTVCSWASLVPSTNNNLASTCGTNNFIRYTHAGNSQINFTMKAHSKTDSGDGNLKAGSNAIPVSNLRVNGGSTCASGSGTTLSTTIATVLGLTNVDRGTYPTTTTRDAYQCITIPLNTPPGNYEGTVDVIVVNA